MACFFGPRSKGWISCHFSWLNVQPFNMGNTFILKGKTEGCTFPGIPRNRKGVSLLMVALELTSVSTTFTYKPCPMMWRLSGYLFHFLCQKSSQCTPHPNRMFLFQIGGSTPLTHSPTLWGPTSRSIFTSSHRTRSLPYLRIWERVFTANTRRMMRPTTMRNPRTIPTAWKRRLRKWFWNQQNLWG